MQYYSNIYNEDNSCLEPETTLSPIFAPTPMPTSNSTVNISAADVPRNETFRLVRPNPYVSADVLGLFKSFADATDVVTAVHWSAISLVCVIVLISISVNLGRLEGPEQEEGEINVLWFLSIHRIFVPLTFAFASRKKYKHILETEDATAPIDQSSTALSAAAEEGKEDLEHRHFKDVAIKPTYVSCVRASRKRRVLLVCACGASLTLFFLFSLVFPA